MSSRRTSTSTDALDPETRFTLLADEHRRRALASLADRTSGMSLTALASAVAAHGDAGATGDEEQVAVALHHVHLPKLADAGVVDYDPIEKTVTPVAVDQFVPFLEPEAER